MTALDSTYQTVIVPYYLNILCQNVDNNDKKGYNVLGLLFLNRDNNKI